MFRTVIDCDLPRDGGTLVMQVEREDSQAVIFWLDRSIHARTPRAWSHEVGRRSLSGGEAREVAAALACLPATDHPVAEFVAALKKQP